MHSLTVNKTVCSGAVFKRAQAALGRRRSLAHQVLSTRMQAPTPRSANGSARQYMAATFSWLPWCCSAAGMPTTRGTHRPMTLMPSTTLQLTPPQAAVLGGAPSMVSQTYPATRCCCAACRRPGGDLPTCLLPPAIAHSPHTASSSKSLLSSAASASLSALVAAAEPPAAACMAAMAAAAASPVAGPLKWSFRNLLRPNARKDLTPSSCCSRESDRILRLSLGS